MPLIDRELAVTLLGAERAEEVVGVALELGLLDERDGRLELHSLLEAFLENRALAETKVKAFEAFPSAWAHYAARNEPDAAFDLADQLGLPKEIDRLLVESMDELLNNARLLTLETWASRALSVGGETAAVLVAQAEIALRRGRHLTAQALADRAVQEEPTTLAVVYRAHIVGGRAAHLGLRENDSLSALQEGRSGRRDRWRTTPSSMGNIDGVGFLGA